MKYIEPAFFLVTKAATWLWYDIVICIDHPHTHNGNYVLMLQYLGPRGLYSNVKGLLFF